MQIIGSQTSPFVRIVRTICSELNQPYDLLETGFFVNMSEEANALVNAHNPLMKVPVLCDGEKNIIETRIIVDYLINKLRDNANTDFDYTINDDQQNIITVILGIADAGILKFIFSKTTDLDPNEGYLKRSATRIEAGLSYLNEQKDLGKSFGVSEVMLLCILQWFKKRNISDWSMHKNLVAIHDRFQDRDSIITTSIPKAA